MKDLDKINAFFLNAQNRSELLQHLANKRGDFKVAYSFTRQDGEKGFSKHKTVIQCQEEEDTQHLLRASHRQIFEEEVVLDFDKKDFDRLGKDILTSVKECSKYFDDLKVYHKVFATGSTGFHIHIPIERSNGSTKSWNRVKATLISKFNCDMLKTSSNVLIALEYAPHWKTGSQKKLIKDTTEEDLQYELSR